MLLSWEPAGGCGRAPALAAALPPADGGGGWGAACSVQSYCCKRSPCKRLSIPLDTKPETRNAARHAPTGPAAVSPDRALCLPTFSHFLIVDKTPLSLFLWGVQLTTSMWWGPGCRCLAARPAEQGAQRCPGREQPWRWSCRRQRDGWSLRLGDKKKNFLITTKNLYSGD